MSKIHKRFLTTGLAAGPPAAAQARVEFNPAGGAVAPPTLPAPPPVTTTSAAGFDWGDAGVGAGGAIVLLGAGTAVVVAGRRRRCRQVPLVPDC